MAVTDKEAFEAMCKVSEYCVSVGCDACIFTYGEDNLCSLGAMPEDWLHRNKKKIADKVRE
jgi:hypothetical protein